jgi:UDP-N-acetylmuramoyl-tripeptide--D-alanyl-D-alanine ligase
MRSIAKSYVVKYLESQAKRLLQTKRPKVIAVAGSVGKTSTKMAIATVLGQKYRVQAHLSSYNTDIGLPLSLFDARVPQQLYNPLAWAWLLFSIHRRYRRRYPYDVVVLEVGTDRPGDVGKLMKYVHPYIGVITAITPEHMEGFGSMEAVVEEEFVLAHNSHKVLLNASDVMLNMKKKDLKPSQVITFGVDKGDYWFSRTDKNTALMSGELHLKNHNLMVDLKLVGRHGLFAVTAAAAAAELLKLSPQQIKQGVEAIKPVAGRMNPLPGVSGSLIIDDSYNSSPDAAIAALASLQELPGGRKLAILGSMNELGAYSAEGHENVGRWAGKLALLVTVGDEAKKHLVQAAIKAGLSKAKIKSFDSPYKAGKYVKDQLKKGDVVLVKGSQNGIFTEEAAKMLLADEADVEQLVRQNSFWQKRKAKQFPLQ